jgi:hypothetical protein
MQDHNLVVWHLPSAQSHLLADVAGVEQQPSLRGAQHIVLAQQEIGWAVRQVGQ